MTYQLSETNKAQLSTFRTQLFYSYREEDALKMDEIIDRALLNGWMSKDDVYALVEVLPRIIPSPKETRQEKSESQSADWNEYIDGQRARYRREMERLHQTLSTLIFMQSAVYRKNTDSLEKPVGKAKFNSIGQGIKK